MPPKSTQQQTTNLPVRQPGGGGLARVGESLPAIVASGGAAARFAHDEFLHGLIRNVHTRRAYRYAIHRFLAYSERQGIALRQITPKLVGEYLDGYLASVGTKKQHLSALRNYFDGLVRRHAIVLNPAASVRSERQQTIEGKTPEISVADARRLLASIDIGNVVGLRDRAVLGTLAYTGVRVGALAKLGRRDFYLGGEQWYFRFSEKGGKSREIPVRSDLAEFVRAFLDASRPTDSEKEGPLFRSAIRRERRLTVRGMTAGDIGRMFKRRMKAAGLSDRLSPHSIRVAVITDLLGQGVPLEDVQHLAGHADPRTTRLYDRRQRKVTRNIVERISI